MPSYYDCRRLVKGVPTDLDYQTFTTVASKAVRTSVRRNGGRGRIAPAGGWLVSSLAALRGVSGPVILTFSLVHLLCYLGIAIWGGRVTDALEGVGGAHYWLNNFNSYASGLVTVFNLMVVK